MHAGDDVFLHMLENAAIVAGSAYGTSIVEPGLLYRERRELGLGIIEQALTDRLMRGGYLWVPGMAPPAWHNRRLVRSPHRTPDCRASVVGVQHAVNPRRAARRRCCRSGMTKAASAAGAEVSLIATSASARTPRCASSTPTRAPLRGAARAGAPPHPREADVLDALARRVSTCQRATCTGLYLLCQL